ncbi:MAG TPA: tyrosine-protein kinase family protein [Clostridiaceae bacterium]|nr:tyrosine-protein kinase family protein [Clostridiaceae bacterium]
MKLPDKQITIVSGHFGTGKTEFAVNLAFAMARDGRKTALADLDIINPYFRSYERSRELEREGVTVFVTSNFGKADIPSLPPDIMSIFVNRQQQSIIDLGGDPVGARLLGVYQPQLDQIDFDFWFVINKNRVENATIDKVSHYLWMTEAMSKQRITGIVNNTHLGDETTADVILCGDAFAANVAKAVNLPLIYTVGERKFGVELKGRLEGSFFPIDRYMTKPWELSDNKGGG